MIRRTPGSKRADTRLPYTTRVRSSSLAELREDSRMENQRVRREMNEDATRHLEQQRREAAASLRKNEELTKTLVMELARSLGGGGKSEPRSEEHPSALQSLIRTSYAVFCL